MLKETITSILLLIGAANAQKIDFGYNAGQIGMTQHGQLRFREYNNISLTQLGVRLGFHGMNEAGKNYLFGRETIKLGLDEELIDVIYATRVAGTEISDVAQIDQAVGLRIGTPASTIMDYGFIDITKHINKSKIEAVIFAGKSIGEVALETTFSMDSDGGKYVEVEVISPTIINTGDIKIKGYGRLEMPGVKLNNNSTLVLGIHGMF